MSRLSSPNYRYKTVVIVDSIKLARHFNSDSVQPGCCVAVAYESKWYLGYVVLRRPAGPSRSFSWPQSKDDVWTPNEHIWMTIPAPTTVKGRQHNNTEETLENKTRI
ncbi:hypothetical protein PR048_015317 [Dryococelus australis]|uniref:Uncharacterized protein n=1 Tax=Dryococelus australis TaxID=614101 RepID=A0ABQ9HGL5_9NEOP|nr:hypothetical protein PR048_015317 [Dryococelus australis]